MATDMHPPYSTGVISVSDEAVKDYEARGFTRVTPVRKSPAKKAEASEK